MQQEYRKILDFIQAGFLKKGIAPLEVEFAESLIPLAHKHKVVTMLYYGFYHSGMFSDKSLEEGLYPFVLDEVLLNEQQLYYIKKISEEFDAKGIDYMVLKGSVLKALYLQPEFRRMGDIDILIKLSQYPLIEETMAGLGFVFVKDTEHEIKWIKDRILIELHKELIPSYNKDLHAYFGNGWKRAIPCGGHGFAFSNEDMFIYLFSHFAKHYRDAGIGILHMCDLYLFLKEKTLNFNYIQEELEKLFLYDFYQNVRATLDVWFEGKEPTEMTEHITNVIFESGVYGLEKKKALSTMIKEKNQFGSFKKGKVHSFLSMLFPPCWFLQKKYRILKKAPILMPLFWIVRWFDVLCNGRDRINRRLQVSTVSEDEMVAYEESLAYVGLEYHFK